MPASSGGWGSDPGTQSRTDNNPQRNPRCHPQPQLLLPSPSTLLPALAAPRHSHSAQHGKQKSPTLGITGARRGRAPNFVPPGSAILSTAPAGVDRSVRQRLAHDARHAHIISATALVNPSLYQQSKHFAFPPPPISYLCSTWQARGRSQAYCPKTTSPRTLTQLAATENPQLMHKDLTKNMPVMGSGRCRDEG